MGSVAPVVVPDVLICDVTGSAPSVVVAFDVSLVMFAGVVTGTN